MTFVVVGASRIKTIFLNGKTDIFLISPMITFLVVPM